MKLPLPRWNSLFARLLVAQIGLAAAVVLVLAALFSVERNIALARLYAERWAQPLADAAGIAARPQAAPPVAVLRRAEPPPSSHHPMPYAPRFAALRRELAARGLPVDDVMLSGEGPQAMVWLHVAAPGRAPAWLGVAGQMGPSGWSSRSLWALGLASLLLVGVAWTFTRRLTRPLESLRARMAEHTPGRPGPAPDGGARTSASPEIEAIDAACSDLLARIERHERERLLLLAGVSHDLRSPLGRIRLAAELLPDDAHLRVRRDAIARNVREADRLIESFLDFVRSSELVFDETVDLAAAGRAVVAAFELPAHQLDIDAPASLMWPRANRLMVERLLANLVDNALKHGHPPVRVSLGGDGTRAWIDVLDAGEGMDPAAVDGLQEAFARGDASRAGSGAGLGLAIVRQVAARLGGEVSFERVAQGQRVRVSLGGGTARG